MSIPGPKEPTPGLSRFSPDAYSGEDYSNSMSLLETPWLYHPLVRKHLLSIINCNYTIQYYY